MNDHTLPDAPALPELTKDEAHLFSTSYHGLAPVREMWMMFGVLMGVQALSNIFSPAGNVFKIVFYVIFLLPLCVRRARQMGAAWYGVVAFALPTLGTLILIALQLQMLLMMKGVMAVESLVGSEQLFSFMKVLGLLTLVVLAPLHVYGGALAGRKSELMRAAIAGDEEMARLLVEDDPRTLLQKSEKGLTAREYAQRQGHHELAAWLREQEEQLNA